MNLIPLNNKIPLNGFQWTKESWNGQLKDNQNAIGIINGDSISCLDIDSSLLAAKEKEYLINNFPTIKTINDGLHVYFNYQGSLEGVKPFKYENEHGGELRLSNCYNVFYNFMDSPRLGFSSGYKPLNCNIYDFDTLPTVKDTDTVFKFIELTKEQDLNTNYITPLSKTLDVSILLPKGIRQNHSLMLKLLQKTYSTGNWQEKDIYFKEWLFLNKFKRHSDDIYTKEWKAMVKTFDMNKGFNFSNLLKQAKDKVQEPSYSNIILPKLNKQVNKDNISYIYEVCSYLSSLSGNNTFFLSMNGLGLNPNVVSKNLQRLQKLGVIKLIDHGLSYGKPELLGGKHGKANKYIFN